MFGIVCTGLFLMFLKWLFWDRAIAQENAGPPREVADPPELW